MEHKELSAWLRLQLTSGIGNVTARKLLTNFGLPQSIFTQSEASLRQVVTTAQARALCSLPDDLAILLDTTWQWLEADIAARRVLTLGDPAYPQSLLNIEDPPLMLYAMGATQAWGSSGLSNS
jgi:DNA processing protein